MKRVVYITLAYGLLIGLVFTGAIYLWLSSKASSEHSISEVQPLFQTPADLVPPADALAGFDSAKLYNAFPKEVYLSKANLQDPMDAEYWLMEMDSKAKNPMQNMKFLSVLLTDELAKKIDSINSLDKAVQVFRWVEGFRKYQPQDPSKKILYTVVGDYWMIKLSKGLASASADNPDLKFKFKFNYLTQRLSDEKYIVDISSTKPEKAVKQLLDTRISYLVGRIQEDVPAWVLAFIGLFGIFTVAAWLVLAVKIFKFFKNINHSAVSAE